MFRNSATFADANRATPANFASKIASRCDSRLGERVDQLCFASQFVEIVSPPLHHLFASLNVRRSVIGSPICVLHCVRKLILYPIHAVAENFIQYGACHRTEPVSGHFRCRYA